MATASLHNYFVNGNDWALIVLAHGVVVAHDLREQRVKRVETLVDDVALRRVLGRSADELVVGIGSMVPTALTPEEAQKTLPETEEVKAAVGGKTIRKIIYVKGRLLNIVVG